MWKQGHGAHHILYLPLPPLGTSLCVTGTDGHEAQNGRFPGAGPMRAPCETDGEGVMPESCSSSLWPQSHFNTTHSSSVTHSLARSLSPVLAILAAQPSLATLCSLYIPCLFLLIMCPLLVGYMLQLPVFPVICVPCLGSPVLLYKLCIL